MTVYAFDIETASWDIFLLGAAVHYGERGERRVEVFRTRAQVAAWYARTGPGDVVLAHNGGNFDFLYLLDAIEAPWIATMSGSGIVSMHVPGHADCRDTYRFAPLSLAKWTGAKWAAVLPCVCGQSCAGYCAFRVEMSEAEYTTVADYCVQDCWALLDTWTEYVDRLDAEGFAVRTKAGAVRRTIGGIAWATAAQICDVGDAPDHERYDAELAAYFGGRVEVFATHAPSGHRYDVNSMYTWGLQQPMPAGRRTVLTRPDDAARAFAMQRPGLYTATVYTRESRFPSLPRRAVDGSLVWATGNAAGTYAEPELRAAVERGARVLVQSAQVYARLADTFRPWTEKGYALREKAAGAGDDRMRAYAKWLLNSLSGKLAMGKDVSTLYVRPDDARMMAWAELPQSRREARLSWLGADAWVDKSHRAVPACARPVCAAYLTAYSRGLLLSRLERAGDDALYCDTDAVYTRAVDDTDVDPVALGKWKHEGAMTLWEARAPKLYRYQDDAGRVNVKAKGIPRADADRWDALAAGGAVALDTGVEGVRRSYARNGRAFARKRDTRALRSDPRAAGLRGVLPSGRTVAPHRTREGDRYVYRWPGLSVDPAEVVERLAPE